MDRQTTTLWCKTGLFTKDWKMWELGNPTLLTYKGQEVANIAIQCMVPVLTNLPISELVCVGTCKDTETFFDSILRPILDAGFSAPKPVSYKSQDFVGVLLVPACVSARWSKYLELLTANKAIGVITMAEIQAQLYVIPELLYPCLEGVFRQFASGCNTDTSNLSVGIFAIPQSKELFQKYLSLSVSEIVIKTEPFELEEDVHAIQINDENFIREHAAAIINALSMVKQGIKALHLPCSEVLANHLEKELVSEIQGLLTDVKEPETKEGASNVNILKGQQLTSDLSRVSENMTNSGQPVHLGMYVLDNIQTHKTKPGLDKTVLVTSESTVTPIKQSWINDGYNTGEKGQVNVTQMSKEIVPRSIGARHFASAAMGNSKDKQDDSRTQQHANSSAVKVNYDKNLLKDKCGDVQNTDGGGDGSGRAKEEFKSSGFTESHKNTEDELCNETDATIPDNRIVGKGDSYKEKGIALSNASFCLRSTSNELGTSHIDIFATAVSRTQVDIEPVVNAASTHKIPLIDDDSPTVTSISKAVDVRSCSMDRQNTSPTLSTLLGVYPQSDSALLYTPERMDGGSDNERGESEHRIEYDDKFENSPSQANEKAASDNLMSPISSFSYDSDSCKSINLGAKSPGELSSSNDVSQEVAARSPQESKCKKAKNINKNKHSTSSRRKKKVNEKPGSQYKARRTASRHNKDKHYHRNSEPLDRNSPIALSHGLDSSFSDSITSNYGRSPDHSSEDGILPQNRRKRRNSDTRLGRPSSKRRRRSNSLDFACEGEMDHLSPGLRRSRDDHNTRVKLRSCIKVPSKSRATQPYIWSRKQAPLGITPERAQTNRMSISITGGNRFVRTDLMANSQPAFRSQNTEYLVSLPLPAFLAELIQIVQHVQSQLGVLGWEAIICKKALIVSSLTATETWMDRLKTQGFRNENELPQWLTSARLLLRILLDFALGNLRKAGFRTISRAYDHKLQAERQMSVLSSLRDASIPVQELEELMEATREICKKRIQELRRLSTAMKYNN